jgi:type II secretory pathway pseudopilin PulG
MRVSLRRKRERRPIERALTLAEAIVSIAVVGVMLVAALNTVGAARMTQKTMGDRSRGMLLAQDLMSEILSQAYEDPEYPPGSFGLAADEIGDGSRALFEDVDDYDGWSASPPQQKDGTELSGFDGWQRSVALKWVDPSDVSQARLSDTGVKYVAVTVSYDNTVIASLVALRTKAVQFVPESE